MVIGRAVAQLGGADALVVQEGAVRRAEVAQGRDQVRAVRGDPDLGVLAADAGVVEHDVGLVAAADDREAGRGQRVGVAVDVQPGTAPGLGGLLAFRVDLPGVQHARAGGLGVARDRRRRRPAPRAGGP